MCPEPRVRELSRDQPSPQSLHSRNFSLSSIPFFLSNRKKKTPTHTEGKATAAVIIKEGGRRRLLQSLLPSWSSASIERSIHSSQNNPRTCVCTWGSRVYIDFRWLRAHKSSSESSFHPVPTHLVSHTNKTTPDGDTIHSLLSFFLSLLDSRRGKKSFIGQSWCLSRGRTDNIEDRCCHDSLLLPCHPSSSSPISSPPPVLLSLPSFSPSCPSSFSFLDGLNSADGRHSVQGTSRRSAPGPPGLRAPGCGHPEAPGSEPEPPHPSANL